MKEFLPPGRPPDSKQPFPDALKTHPTHTTATLRELTLEKASAVKADPPLSIDYTAISLNALDPFDLSLTAVPTATFDCRLHGPTLQGGSEITQKFYPSTIWTSIPPSLPITSPSPPPSSGPPLPDLDGDISCDFHLGSPSRAPFALAPLAPRLGLHHA